MQARYYDPVIGRFYSNDPVEFTNIHTFNRYVYANNNPYKYTDPDGREVKIQWHEVTLFGFGTGANHSLLTLIPDNIGDFKGSCCHYPVFSETNSAGGNYASVGAGPGGLWDLKAGFNRTNDAKEHSGGIVLSPLKGMSDTDLIKAIITNTSNYLANTSNTFTDGVDYSFKPNGLTSDVNSNSFISGLLNSLGYDSKDFNVPNAPGWDKPASLDLFKKPEI